MSLVNRMLQDLDRRHASGADRAALPPELRPLPPPRPRRWPWLVAGLGLCGVAVGALATARWLDPPGAPPASPAVMPAPVAPVTVTPVPVAAAPGPLPEVAREGATAAGVAPAMVAAASPPADAGPAPPPSGPAGLRVATVLERPPQWAPARPAPEPERAAVAAVSPAPREPDPRGVAAPPAPPLSEAPPRIEKRERSATPREKADGHFRRAVAAINQGRLTEALAGFEAALRDDPAYVAVRLAYAAALAEDRRRGEARALLAEGLALAAEPPLALQLARLAVADGDDATALAALTRASAAAAEDAEFRGLHAAVLARAGRHREAIGEYQAALRRVPGAGVWWMGLGLSLEAEGQVGEAREALRRARASGALSAELARFVDQRLKQLN